MSKLKLFIWPEFSPSWTNGLAFAIAKNEKEAKKLVCAFDDTDWGPVIVRRTDWRVAYYVSGGD